MKKLLLFSSAGLLGLLLVVGYLVVIGRLSYANSKRIGGVVPHHNLVEEKIRDFWEDLKQASPPEIIFLIGPDHNNQSKAPIVFTGNAEVFQEKVTLNKEFLAQLEELGVTEDDSAFAQEHSVQIHVPYITQLFPTASVVPMLFRSDAKMSDVVKLAQKLGSSEQEYTVVASVDFSHYLNVEEATAKDLISLQALENFDYETLSTFGPEYTDSDQSLIFLSEMVCPQRHCSWEELFHGNSTQFDPTNPLATTSYYSFLIKNVNSLTK